MLIHDVHQGIHTQKPRKRVGRGIGSGHGKTCGRGHKGAKSRSGYARHFGAEGGQMPLFRRIAKRGFNNAQFALRVAEVNVAALEAHFPAGAEITPELLAQSDLAQGKFDIVKILGNGALTKPFTVRAHRFSASAEQKILAAGGIIERLEE
ncbi:MAG: 50S ribosomal protein L15 [Planctomycetaceae bacterium]|nr:MAG: 50S ribosomal protein L15 [Planctomycetaceae bacterium]